MCHPQHPSKASKRAAAPPPALAVPAPSPDSAERPDLAAIRTQYQVADDRMVMYKLRVGSVPIPFVEEIELTATEAKMLDGIGTFRVGSFAIIRRLAYAASETFVRTPSEVTYPPGAVTDGDKRDWLTNGGHRDALRHAYWNALMARHYGQNWAEQFATAHEAKPGNPGDLEAMDLYNNSVGRRIAAEHPSASDAELAHRVNEALKKGQLVVLDEDGNLQWSDRVRPWRHGLSDKVTGEGGWPVPDGDAPARPAPPR